MNWTKENPLSEGDPDDGDKLYGLAIPYLVHSSEREYACNIEMAHPKIGHS